MHVVPRVVRVRYDLPHDAQFEQNDFLDTMEPQPSMAELFDDTDREPGRS